MRNRPFEIRPIGGALGAELHGIDLSAELSDETISAVRQALLDHLVIFFRDQELPPDRFLALARRFGTPIEYPFVKGIEGFPEIINVAKLEHEKINFGGVWHSDTTYLQEPPMATLLVARDVPEAGGDTIFANQYLALDALSDTLRGKLPACAASPAPPRPTPAARARTASAPMAAPMRASCWSPNIRSVRTHPETGRKALYVNRAHTVGFRRHDRGRERAAAGIPVQPSDPSGVHLPLPLDAGRTGDLGQSLRAALCGERLRRPPPHHAAHHARR